MSAQLDPVDDAAILPLGPDGQPVDVVLVTCSPMPKPDLDLPGLTEALAETGLSVRVATWDEPLDWGAVPLVVLRTPWDYVDRAEEFGAWATGVASATVLSNPLEVIEWNLHKRYLFDLEAAGVPIVPTRSVAQFAPFPFQRVVLRQFDTEVVVKPAVGIGAFGVHRGAPDHLDTQAHLEALALLGDVLVQPLVESVTTRGESSLVFLGGEFSHAVRKVPASGDFRVQDHHGGTVLDHDPTPAELDVAAAALAVAPASVDYARVDLVEVDGRPVVMELELIEPELFLRRHEPAARRFAQVIADRAGSAAAR